MRDVDALALAEIGDGTGEIRIGEAADVERPAVQSMGHHGDV